MYILLKIISFLKLIFRIFRVFFAGQRKSNAYLDVPSANFNHLQISDNDDEDVDRLRTFSASKGGKFYFRPMVFIFCVDIHHVFNYMYVKELFPQTRIADALNRVSPYLQHRNCYKNIKYVSTKKYLR